MAFAGLAAEGEHGAIADGRPPPDRAGGSGAAVTSWPLGRKLVVGLAISALPGLGTLAVSLHDLHALSRRMDRLVVEHTGALLQVARIRRALDRERSAVSGYLLTGDERLVDAVVAARAECEENLVPTRRAPDGSGLLGEIDRAWDQELAATDEAIRGKRTAAKEGSTERLEMTLQPARRRVDDALDGYMLRAEVAVERERHDAVAAATRAANRVAVVAVVGAVWAAVLAALLSRAIKRLRAWQAQLAAYVDQIEGSNQDLDAFAGRIAHDVRNALTPLGILPEVLRKAARVDDTSEGRAAAIERIAGQAERAVTRAWGLIDALLAFSRAQIDDGAITRSVAAVVDDVLEELEPLAQRVGVHVERQIEDAAVRLSPGLLHVVLANLLSNAIKFQEGREARWARIAAARQGDELEIVVEDAGPGIPREAIDRVFEPFYRGPGVQASGSGIGLATVRRVIDAHDGRIGVTSTVGEGTTFRIRLAVAAARGTGEASERRPSRSSVRTRPVGADI